MHENGDTPRTIRVYRYPLRLGPTQSAKLESWLRFACRLYNAALEERTQAWSSAWRWWNPDRKRWVWRDGRSVTRIDQGRQLTQFRREHPDLLPPGMPALVQHEVLQRLDRAFQAFFRRCKNGEAPGYPRFRSARRYESLTFGLTHGNTSGAGWARGGDLVLSGLGRLPVDWPSRRPLPTDAVARQAIVVRRPRGWEVCIVCEVPDVGRVEGAKPAAAVDMGIWQWATVYCETEEVVRACHDDLNRVLAQDGRREPWASLAVDGHERERAILIRGPFLGHPGDPEFRRAHRDVLRLQRALARCARRSKGHELAVAALARAYEHEAEIRHYHRAKVADVLARHFGLIYVEALEIKEMVPSAAGTKESPGVQVAQQADLHRRLLDQGWGYFFAALEHEVQERGGTVQRMDPQYTTQTCSECGAVEPKTPTSRVHRCPECGYTVWRTVNSARNLLTFGQRSSAS